MRREVDISPEHLLTDKSNTNEEYVKVVKVEEDEKTAKVGTGSIIFLLASTLAAVIIISTCIGLNSKDKNTTQKFTNKTTVSSEVKNNNKETNNKKEETTKKDETITFEDENDGENIEREHRDYTIDYSNVETFYNHIADNRSKYGSFAESFQSEQDVKNFINFLYKFDELYDNVDTTTPINSQEMYDNIIQDYYKSCVSHDVKGELNLLFSNNKLAQQKVAEAELLTYDLKNGKGKDYTIANNYYTWILVNFIDGRTMVDRTTNNAPFIDALREQFEQYRYSGNMLNARKYQKNDSLPVESTHLYYADEAPKDVEVTEVQNSLTCPDWGVDNVFSKYEEDTETKLLIKRDGQDTFQRVDEEFNIVLNKGKVK